MKIYRTADQTFQYEWKKCKTQGSRFEQGLDLFAMISI